MAASGDPRQFVLGHLSERCGFQFNESSDLSPDTRREIGALARDLQGIWALDSQVAGEWALMRKGTALAKLPAALGSLLVFLVILAVSYSGPMAESAELFVVGVLFIALGAVVSQRRKHRISAVIAGMQKTRAGQWDAWARRADALSSKIVEESREVYQQKVKPKVIEVKVDFAEIMKAAQGKGVIIDRVKCPSCGAVVALPPSGQVARCSYCGSEITATSVFDKMRSVLA